MLNKLLKKFLGGKEATGGDIMVSLPIKRKFLVEALYKQLQDDDTKDEIIKKIKERAEAFRAGKEGEKTN